LLGNCSSYAGSFISLSSAFLLYNESKIYGLGKGIIGTQIIASVSKIMEYFLYSPPSPQSGG